MMLTVLLLQEKISALRCFLITSRSKKRVTDQTDWKNIEIVTSQMQFYIHFLFWNI